MTPQDPNDQLKAAVEPDIAAPSAGDMGVRLVGAVVVQQAWVLQAWDWVVPQALIRVWVPPPQPAEQAVQAPKVLASQAMVVMYCTSLQVPSSGACHQRRPVASKAQCWDTEPTGPYQGSQVIQFGQVDGDPGALEHVLPVQPSPLLLRLLVRLGEMGLG